MHADQIAEARALATPVTHSQTAVDTTPALVVQYCPDCGTGATSASIALVQNSSMTFLVDSTTPAGADAIGASGVVLTSSSTYDTMGELVDYINGLRAWRAYLVACLRADASSILLAKSATICSGDNGLTFYIDTSQNEGALVPGTAAAYEIVGAAISGEKFVNNGKNGHVTDKDDGCENSLCYAEVQVTCTGDAENLRIYSAPQDATETLLYNYTLTSTTEVDLGRTGTTQQDGIDSVFIRAKRGERLVIRAATDSAFSAVTKFNITGKTAVLKGNRMVDEDNY